MFKPILPAPARGCNAAEVAGLFADDDLAHLPAVLRRPGPQPCNQIPPTYAEALRRLTAGRPRWPHLPLWLRVARMVRRWIRSAIAAEVAVLVAELRRCRAAVNGRAD